MRVSGFFLCVCGCMRVCVCACVGVGGWVGECGCAWWVGMAGREGMHVCS